jgi:hypothetical protein
MKKLLISIFICLSSVVCFSQVTTFQAYRYFLGDPSPMEQNWSFSDDCNVLVVFDNDGLTIYSEEKQFYVLSNLISNTTKNTKWSAVDLKGLNCFVNLGYNADRKSAYLLIEYNNIMFCYYMY